MAKEDLLTLDGEIDEILPDGRFGVMLENGHRIIAYTAHALDDERQNYLACGFDDIITKPITVGSLNAAVGRAPGSPAPQA